MTHQTGLDTSTAVARKNMRHRKRRADMCTAPPSHRRRWRLLNGGSKSQVAPAFFAVLAVERPEPGAIGALLGHGGRRHEKALSSAFAALYLRESDSAVEGGRASSSDTLEALLWERGPFIHLHLFVELESRLWSISRTKKSAAVGNMHMSGCEHQSSTYLPTLCMWKKKISVHLSPDTFPR